MHDKWIYISIVLAKNCYIDQSAEACLTNIQGYQLKAFSRKLGFEWMMF